MDNRGKQPLPTGLYGRRYPWGKWLAQESFTLAKGQDYNGRSDTFACQLRQQARARGLALQITIAPDAGSLAVRVLLPAAVARDGRRYNSVGGTAPRPVIQRQLFGGPASADVARG